LERKQRLFLAACCRRTWPLLVDERSRRAVELAERYADRAAGKAALRRAHEAAAAAYDKARRTADARAYCAACPAAEVSRVDFRGGFERCTYGADLATLARAARSAAPDTPAEYDQDVRSSEEAAQADLLRDIFGNLFRRVAFEPAWRTPAVLALAQQLYQARDFSALPILGDALEEAGCSDERLPGHCRASGPHVRGCFVVDLVLAKE
jgi:hypothetical protein